MSAPTPPLLGRAVTANSDYTCEDDEEFVYDEYDPFTAPGGASPSGGRAGTIYESSHQLAEEEKRRVEEAIECTGISPDEAFLLLRRQGWDVAAFTEAFFEDADRLRRDAGVSEESGRAGPGAARGLCGICFTSTGVPMLPCEGRPLKPPGGAHPSYCLDCWRQFAVNAVEGGRGCLDLRCPTPGCGEALRPTTFERLLQPSVDRRVLERYARFVTESLVDDSKGHLAWCPGRKCNRAAAQPPAGTQEVKCRCGLTWCFGCRTSAHMPVSCETVQKWEARNRDQGADATWIRANTKLCPKCQHPIEKNGGCMHMTCRKPGGCGHEFCWICMKDWKNHSACNASSQKDEQEWAKAKDKSDLLRYGHYFERYIAHHKAQLFASDSQMSGMESLANLLIDVHSFKAEDVQFLTEAVREIADSRCFLKWTYVHIYLARMTKSQQTFFEFHQAQLEGTLERLSDIMENTAWEDYLDKNTSSFRPFFDLRSKIVDMTNVVHKFFAHLAEAIEQGTLFSG